MSLKFCAFDVEGLDFFVCLGELCLEFASFGPMVIRRDSDVRVRAMMRFRGARMTRLMASAGSRTRPVMGCRDVSFMIRGIGIRSMRYVSVEASKINSIFQERGRR